jgi:transposase
MSLQNGTNDCFNTRIRAVRQYQKSGSIENVASSFKIHPVTLRRWIKRYQTGGEESLKTRKGYKKHPKRFVPVIEKKVVMLKEKNPSLTLSEAQDILEKDMIKISINGIWRIWERYNFAGFHKKNFQSDGKIAHTSEIQDGLEKAEQALSKGNMKKAAQILNALPECAENLILRKIPDRLLSLQRRVEKLDVAYVVTPFRETLRKARIMQKRAENKKLFYTSVRAGLCELFAMNGMDYTPEKQLVLAQRLLKKLGGEGSPDNVEPELHFLLLLGKARALADLGRTRTVLSCMKKCENICHHLNNAKSYRIVAATYSLVGFYKKSRRWIEKSLKCPKDRRRDNSHAYMAGNLALAGEYRTARKRLRLIKLDAPWFQSLVAIVKADCSLARGKIQDASQYANEALLIANKQRVFTYLIASSLRLVYCSCALNKKAKAISQLKRLIHQTKRYALKKNPLFIKVLLGQNSLPHDAVVRPNIKLTHLLCQASGYLRINDYRKAFKYAKAHQIMGLFHRLILFFPEPVNKLIAKGKPTGLPKALLKLPVFQKNVPVYHLKFLGPVHIYRNSIQLRDDPTPMYASFVIHLVFKKKIELASLYNNFWHHTKNPKASLSHLLYGLRKFLRLAPNTLLIKDGFLHFKGYITTDYQYYEQTITRAKALERAGEWIFAKKEYLRAFKVFRGEPFKKMYDPWSEHMRRVILNGLETEATHFAKSCFRHNNKNDARRILDKALKIIPNSEEIEKMVREYGGNGVSEKRRIQKTCSH